MLLKKIPLFLLILILATLGCSLPQTSALSPTASTAPKRLSPRPPKKAAQSKPPTTTPTPASTTTPAPSPSPLPQFFNPNKLGTSETNLTYCIPQGQDLKLDVHYPTSADKPWPAVVYIHGGGLSKGNKSGGAGLIYFQPLTQANFLVISINYRLLPQNKFPAQIEDAKCAIRFLRDNANTFNLDPNHIGVYGTSAGGYLASLVGTTDSDAGFEGQATSSEQSSRVQAVASLFGPSDFTVDCQSNLVKFFFGQSVCDDRNLLASASPITHVSPDDPPFLLIHGSRDHVVPLAHARSLNDSLQAAGVPVTLVIVANADHGFTPRSGTPDPSKPEIIQILVDFFIQHLQ